MMKPMQVALFDIEGTLFTAPMGYGFIRYSRSNQRWMRAWTYFARIMPRYYLHKLKIGSREAVFRKAIELMAWLIQGYTLDQAKAAFDWVVFDHILPSGREEVLSRLREHQAQGHSTLIVSSGFTPCLHRIAEHLKISGVVGTELEVLEGSYSGKILPPVLIGDEKGLRVREYYRSQGAQVDWAASFAYADSAHDLSMLELVGHPVAVNPEPELRKLARERGWEVLD